MNFCKIEHSKYPDVFNIFAYTTGVCNYACKYCSFNAQKILKFLDLNTLKKFVLQLYDNRKQNIYIELIGGEPTLDKHILDFSNSLYNYYPYIRIGLYTNFSQHINLYQQLVNNKVNMTITWHSQSNSFYNNSFIHKLSLLPREAFDTHVDVHVMYEIDHIDESISMFKTLKTKYKSTELRLLDYDFSTNKIYFLDNAFYTVKQLIKYNNIINSYPNINKITIKTSDQNNTQKLYSVNDIYRNKNFYTFKHWLCDAGYNYIYIDITGNIYPCLKYREENTHCIGNILNLSNIQFKKFICKFDRCPCVWEAKKENILNK